jgi:hypothetical protein
MNVVGVEWTFEASAGKTWRSAPLQTPQCGHPHRTFAEALQVLVRPKERFTSVRLSCFSGSLRDTSI